MLKSRYSLRPLRVHTWEMLTSSIFTGVPGTTGKPPGRAVWARQHAALPSHPEQGPSSPRAPQPHQQPAHQKQQRKDYRKISEQWQVRRAPFRDYPQQQQEAIANGRQRRPSPSPSPAQAMHQRIVPEVHKLQTVLEYEAQHGHQNTVGREGETFASWAERALTSLALQVAVADVTSAQRFANLAQQMQAYGTTLSLQQRAALVSEAAAVAATSSRVLQDNLHPSRTQRYSAVQMPPEPPPASSTAAAPAAAEPDDDTLAAEAHAEETAEAAAVAFAAPRPEGSDAGGGGEAAGEPVVAASAVAAERAAGGGRRVKEETLKFRSDFVKTALAYGAGAHRRIADLSGGEQRSAEWMALRGRRLTASAFAKALGFFSGDRMSLWEEKVGLREPFKGNDATRWGTNAEATALSAYQALTGQSVEGCMFQVKHDDAPHGWLGASPDALISGLSINSTAGGGGSAAVRESLAATGLATAPAQGSPSPLQGPGAGVLEIKCPFNKGHPELAVPPRHAIWYYMPQVQGLMDIFDREWCNLYVWTPAHGSALFHVRRDRAYWAACFDVLAEFWWAHVVPARQAHGQGGTADDVLALRPSEEHPAGRALVGWSKRLAAAAPAVTFAPLPAAAQQYGHSG